MNHTSFVSLPVACQCPRSAILPCVWTASDRQSSLDNACLRLSVSASTMHVCGFRSTPSDENQSSCCLWFAHAYARLNPFRLLSACSAICLCNTHIRRLTLQLRAPRNEGILFVCAHMQVMNDFFIATHFIYIILCFLFCLHSHDRIRNYSSNHVCSKPRVDRKTNYTKANNARLMHKLHSAMGGPECVSAIECTHNNNTSESRRKL